MTRASSEYFELSVFEFSSGQRYFETSSDEDWSALKAYVKGELSNHKLVVHSVQQNGIKCVSEPILVDNGIGLFLHDSFYTFLKSLNMDNLWDTYPVELYERDGKTRIPNYHHGLVVKQHVPKVSPTWATPRIPGDPSYGYSPMKGTWFNEAELKDDRLFSIGIRIIFRQDIKEKIEAAFPEGLKWKNLRDV
jgi:hypothetical protein